MTRPEELKPGWRTVKFGDVVRDVKNTTKDPEADGLERVVGLDHLDPESLPLRRWDELADLHEGTSFTRTFKAGQVLFGKRRSYQRKVAVPDFDGICSGDILVFEPSSEQLLPEFLPYLVQSDGFFDHALGTSAGSLSPRTKWQELAKYEFALPPLDEQKNIVKTLSVATTLGEAHRSVHTATDLLVKRFIVERFDSWASAFEAVPVPALGELRLGRQKAPKYELGVCPTPYVRVANIGNLAFDSREFETMDFSEVDQDRYGLKAGDVLITEGDIVSAFNVGRPAVFPGSATPVCFQNTLIRLRPNAGLDPTFLMGLLEGARLNGVFAAAASTTTVSHLGLKRLTAIALPLPNGIEQKKFAEALRSLLELRATAARATAGFQSVRICLGRELLG